MQRRLPIRIHPGRPALHQARPVARRPGPGTHAHADRHLGGAAQAFRRALPGCGNEIIYLIKYSSLASIITVNDLTGMGRGLAKSTFRNTEVFIVVGIYYLALVTVATFLLRWVEHKLAIPGFENKKE